MFKKKINRTWFFQGRKVEISSIAAVCVYVILLILGVFLFYYWNVVSTRTFVFQAETIKSNMLLTDSEKTNSYSVPRLELKLSIPMSMQQSVSSSIKEGKVDYWIDTDWKNTETDTTYMDLYTYAMLYHRDSLAGIVNKYVDLQLYEMDNKKILNNNKSLKDSILNFVNNKQQIADSYKSNVFYISFLQKTTEGDYAIFRPKKEFNEFAGSLFKNKRCYSFLTCTGTKDSIFTENIFCSDSPSLFASNIQNRGALSTPHWLNLSDISQGYYVVNLKSTTFNDLKLVLDFNGVTNFSTLNPLPDYQTMTAITYTDPIKIKQIKKNGLMFHASFPEMQNKQSVRIFVLTTMMTLIIGLLLKDLLFLILGLFRKKL